MGKVNNKNEKAFLRSVIIGKPYLFWYVRNIDFLSSESIVEAILCRGDFSDFLELIRALGIKNTAEIFFKQVSMKRTNYNKKTGNYFTLFFKKHLENV